MGVTTYALLCWALAVLMLLVAFGLAIICRKPSHVVAWPFVVSALAMSMFYGLADRAIFDRRPDKAAIKDQCGVSPYLLHKFWFNFLGSLVGWGCAWAVLKPLWFGPLFYPGLESRHLLFAFVGLLGVTGWLPPATVGLARSLEAVLKRVAG